MKKLPLGLVGAATLALAGCASRMVGLTQSEAFTFGNLTSGKILVAGVVVAGSPKLNLSESVKDAELLKRQLVEERRGVPVDGPGTLAQALGEKQFEALLQTYQRTGAVDTAQLKTAVGNRTRFVAFARVDSDTTQRTEHEIPERVFERQGRRRTEPGYTEKQHTRVVSATIHVYDLKLGDLAFSGQLTKEDTNRRRYQNNLVRGISLVVSAVQGKEDSLSPFPEAPDRQVVLQRVFRGFGENFPKN